MVWYTTLSDYVVMAYIVTDLSMAYIVLVLVMAYIVMGYLVGMVHHIIGTEHNTEVAPSCGPEIFAAPVYNNTVPQY